jgi:hypothetical protein
LLVQIFSGKEVVKSQVETVSKNGHFLVGHLDSKFVRVAGLIPLNLPIVTQLTQMFVFLRHYQA